MRTNSLPGPDLLAVRVAPTKAEVVQWECEVKWRRGMVSFRGRCQAKQRYFVTVVCVCVDVQCWCSNERFLWAWQEQSWCCTCPMIFQDFIYSFALEGEGRIRLSITAHIKAAVAWLLIYRMCTITHITTFFLTPAAEVIQSKVHPTIHSVHFQISPYLQTSEPSPGIVRFVSCRCFLDWVNSSSYPVIMH